MAVENEAPTVVQSPVGVPNTKGTKNSDGFVKGQVLTDEEYQQHMAKERQKLKK